jgi:hypothetical protein
MSSRTKFLLLVGVFVVPVVAAYLAYFGWRPAGHKNYGELISVTPLQQTQGSLLDGEAFDLGQLQGKWLMLHVGPAACDARCERQLYLMRQIRIAQGKGQSRIERVWVLTDAGVPAAQLLEEYPGMHVWRPGSASFAAQFPAPVRHDLSGTGTPAPLACGFRYAGRWCQGDRRATRGRL